MVGITDTPATSEPSILDAVAAILSHVQVASSAASTAGAAVVAAEAAEAAAVAAKDLAAQYAAYTENAIESAFSAMQLQGVWNAQTNTPALSSGTGTAGYFYVVGTQGTTSLDGITTWFVNDIAFFDGTIWRRIAASGQSTISSSNITDATAVGRALLTAASVAAQRIALLVDEITTVNDADKVITASMRTVAWTALSTSRVATLPAASAMNPGQMLLVLDASGSASPTRTITINRSGSDTINGATSVAIDLARGAYILVPNTNSWVAVKIGSDTSAFLRHDTTATISKGFSITPYNGGTPGAGTTYSIDPANGNYQYLTNNGAFTIAAPSSDCAVDILVTNGASAGAITMSGFTAPSGGGGDTYATTNAYRFLLMVRRINSISTFSWKALQ